MGNRSEPLADFVIDELILISACMGHHEVKITEDVYINIKEPIYDCSKEIGSFIAEIMPVEKNILEIPIDPNYLLEVLP